MTKNEEILRYILSEVLECGTADIDCIIDMENNFPDMTQKAMEIKEEINTSLNFGVFVMATKEMAINEVENELTEEELESLQDMIIDDNYIAWGAVAAYGINEGKGLSNKAQNLFADYIVTGEEEDKNKFLNKVKEEREEK